MGVSALTAGQRAWLQEFLTTNGPDRKRVQLRKGQRLFVRGTEANSVHMVLKGQIKLDAPNTNPEVCHPNCWLFEHAHELGHSYLQTATALTDCTVVEFQSDVFSGLLSQHRALTVKFLEDTAKRVADRNHVEPAATRLARQLLAMIEAKATVRVVKTTPMRLGTLVGVTRTRANDVIKRFVSLGLMTKIDRDHYQLHRELLQRFLGDDT